MRRHSHPPPTEVRLCLREPNGRSLPDSALPPAGSAQDNDAPRQLVVCIDGTSNRFGDQPTNVVRLYRSLSRDPRRVLAYYDQGVGTFGLKETLFEWQKFPSRIAGLAFGWGSSATSRAPIASSPSTTGPATRYSSSAFPRGLRGAGAGRDAARGGPDRCAPAAPLRLRLDPAHHPHAAPRRRQAGRHASPRTGLRPAGTLPQGLRPAGEGALPRPVRHRDLGGLGLRPADRAVFLEQRNGRRGPPGPGHRRMPLLLPAEPLVRREGPQVRRVAGVVPRHALRCRRWLCAEGLAAGSGGLYLDARRGAGGRPACRPGAQPRPVARTFEAGPGPDRADPAGDDPALAPGRVAAAAGLGPPQRQPRLALVAWPAALAAAGTGRAGNRVKLHRSVQRRLDECPDYRPCNLPALERCDLIDDSPLLDGYR